MIEARRIPRVQRSILFALRSCSTQARSALLFGILIANGAGACAKRSTEPPPIIGELPEFLLLDQHGNERNVESLRGEPLIASFIFTRCVTACPLLTSQMLNLQNRLGDLKEKVKMLSITVDPEYDTPEVLAAYAKERGADYRWIYLTGPLADVRIAIERGFRVRAGDRVPLGADGFDILHATHLVLLDEEARIRGYYRSDGEGLEELERDIRALFAK